MRRRHSAASDDPERRGPLADVLDAIARHGLDGEIDRPILSDALARPMWVHLSNACVRQRLTGHLAAASDDGSLAVRPRQRFEAIALHERAKQVVDDLERFAIDIYDALSAADIEVRLLKGPAIAGWAYRDPTRRTFGDVDLLVRGEDIEAALSVIEGQGGERLYPEPRPGFDRRFTKGVALRLPRGEIDLHRTLVKGNFGFWVDMDELWKESLAVPVAGTTMAALDPPRALLHAAYHLSLGASATRRSTMRDLAEMLAGRRVDHVETRTLARSWRAEALLARALCTMSTTLDLRCGDPLTEWASGYVASPREERALEVHRGDNERSARQALSGLRAVSGARNRFAYALAIAFPRHTSSGVTRSQRWLKGARAAARRPRSS